ncbi:MAG: peptidylprolyl isomerase [Candidatus Thermoplasmatota archaeon]|jgi:FKBP-type peptidyl-prolyl cis-trans isomerase 2
MALKDGDVVRFDYTLYVDGKMVETSEESVAKANNIHREARNYRPLTVTLGSRQIIAGLESHMRSHGQKGKAVTVDIAAVDAYGERDAKKIQTIPLQKFKAQKVQPQVGMQLNMGNERGTVTQVAGGRVRVDLNHDLAGKALRYDYTIRDVVADEAGKVEAVLANIFGPGGAKATVTADAITVEVPDQVKFDQNWMMAKFRIVADLRTVSDKKKAIHLVEVFPVMDDTGLVPGHEGHQHGPGESH